MGSTGDIPNMVMANNFPTPSQFPIYFTKFVRMRKRTTGLKGLEIPYMTLLDRSGSNQSHGWGAVTHQFPGESQIVNDLGLLIFQISNNLSTGNNHDDKMLFSNLGYGLTSLARSSSSWKGLLTAGGGATSRSLIEQLFEFSVVDNNTSLAEMMLQIGADPNQRICDRNPRERCSALEFAVSMNSSSLMSFASRISRP